MSAPETAIDNMAKGQALKRQAPTGTEYCPEGCVRIGVFFDGTGNNYHKDKLTTDPMNPPKKGRAPSNVAKLWEVYKEDAAPAQLDGDVLKPHATGVQRTTGRRR